MMFLTTSLTFPALSLILYVTCFVPIVEVSTVDGVIVNSPSIPDRPSLYVTPLVRFTTSFRLTFISPIPSIVGNTLSIW